MKFHLVMNKELAQAVAAELQADSSITVDIKSGTQREKEQLQLGLTDVSMMVGVLVGGVKLAEASFAAAKAIRNWMKQNRQDPEKIIVRGPHDDAMVTVDDALTTEALAAKIETVANK